LRPGAHPKSVLDVHRVAEYNTQVAANFLRIELQCGHVFASIGLSTNDERRRIRNTANAGIAYNAILRFMGRVALNGEQARELADGIESLKRMLVALSERRWNIVGRRLDDRIHMLAAKAEEFPTNSPASQEITELMKAELSEYFEREKNPPYGADRRSSEHR
jgi:hypothetical protein